MLGTATQIYKRDYPRRDRTSVENMFDTEYVNFHSEISPAEQWFDCQARQLKLLAPIPELALVRRVLEQHLPQRVARVIPRLSRPNNASEWLALILKANFLINLQQSGDPVGGTGNARDHRTTVALNVSGGHNIPASQFELIQSPEFSAARRELGISKHWCLTVGNIAIVPSSDELLDLLYKQLEIDTECAAFQICDRVSTSL